MATTTNFGWETPDDTDLVKDGALAIRTLGSAIDTSLVDLKGGTTGQVLSKTSNTDMDFTWVTSDDANAIQNAIVDAKGDLIAASAADTPARLAVGANDTVLIADSSTSTGLKWAEIAPAWTSYTPTVKGGATTVTTNIQYAKYLKINKLVFVQASIIVTSTGGTNGVITISLPSGLLPAAQNSRFTRGTFMLTDAGVGFYTGTAIIYSDNVYGMSGSAGDFMGANTPAMTLVNTDEVSFNIVYEVA